MTPTPPRLTQTLPHLIAVHARAGLTIPPVAWPDGYEKDGYWHAYRAEDVPPETRAGYAAVFAEFVGSGSRVIVPWRFSLVCATNEAIPTTCEALGLDIVQRLAFARGLVVVEPRVGWKDAGSPFDLVERASAHPDVRKAEPVWLQLFGPRG